MNVRVVRVSFFTCPTHSSVTSTSYQVNFTAISGTAAPRFKWMRSLCAVIIIIVVGRNGWIEKLHLSYRAAANAYQRWCGSSYEFSEVEEEYDRNEGETRPLLKKIAVISSLGEVIPTKKLSLERQAQDAVCKQFLRLELLEEQRHRMNGRN